MNSKLHILFAVILFLLAWYFFNLSFVSIIFVLFGAVFPDIDLSNSMIRKVLNLIAVLIAIFILLTTFNYINSILFLGMWFILTWIIPHHRGIMHSWVAGIIISILFYFVFGFEAGFGFLFGFATHLIADGCFLKFF